MSHGLLWRVGEGRSITIWNTRWLPTPITYSVQSPQRILGENSVVGDLIDQRHGIWKSALILEVFLPKKAQVIVNIPLSLL